MIAIALVAWRAWPREPGQVAPEVTARELSQVRHAEMASLTRVGGGSVSQAHQLWAYYHARPAYQGVKPRLLGISRVHLSGTSWDGTYWLVFSDNVYQQSYGTDASAGRYSREAVFVPDDGKSVKGNIMTF
jgi:hypothetical protein